MSFGGSEDSMEADVPQYHVHLQLELYSARVGCNKMQKLHCQCEVVQMSEPEHPVLHD